MDDCGIIDALTENEERGYSLLIDQYTPYVAAVLTGICKDAFPAEDIEEMAADVFFKVWQRRGRLRTGKLKAYIAQTARNTAIDRLRKKRIPLVPYEDDILRIRTGDQPEGLAELREQKAIMERAVDGFGEPDREIFIRFYYFGEPLKAIAQRLEIKTATAKTKLYRSREALKGLFRERGYDCE